MNGNGDDRNDRNDRNGPLRVDRRTTLKWLAATMAATHAACGRSGRNVGDEIPPPPSKPLGEPAAAGAKTYGTDPDLMDPAVPWPRTMTEAQLAATAALCDVILPADERSPAASALGVPDFIDEWVSAPYEQQRADRGVVFEGLDRLETECRRRHGAGFAEADDAVRDALVAEIATPGNGDADARARHEFFRRVRFLAVGAFYTSEAGASDIGYIGNVAISGEYPGPSDAAMAHLAGVLAQLDLAMPA